MASRECRRLCQRMTLMVSVCKGRATSILFLRIQRQSSFTSSKELVKSLVVGASSTPAAVETSAAAPASAKEPTLEAKPKSLNDPNAAMALRRLSAEWQRVARHSAWWRLPQVPSLPAACLCRKCECRSQDLHHVSGIDVCCRSAGWARFCSEVPPALCTLDKLGFRTRFARTIPPLTREAPVFLEPP